MAQRYIEGAGEFFDRLNSSGLPEAVRNRVGDTLSVLLEDDGEIVAANPDSFAAFLLYLRQHADRALPSIGLNRKGQFVAIWREAAFRLTFEFEPTGSIHWLSTEFTGGTPFVREGQGRPEEAPLPPRQRQFA